jgi:hypothetical protein
MESAFQWMAVTEHTDEMCDGKEKDEVVPCPAECQDMTANVGSKCINSLSCRSILGENFPDSVCVEGLLGAEPVEKRCWREYFCSCLE